MASIGIFFGSDTGNTENIAKMIQQKLGSNQAELHDIAKSSKEDLQAYKLLLLGVPTWYYGEMQCDWDDFLPTLKEIDFSGKTVALFGCGDQEDYAEYFCDAMGTIYDIVHDSSAKIIGLWPHQKLSEDNSNPSPHDYYFEASKALLDDNHFCGLTIDEDRQPDLTENRVEQWVNQIKEEWAKG